VTIDLGGSPAAPDPAGGPTGLLLSRDLIFTSKVAGTARALGRQVLTAGNAALALAMVEQWRPRAVFVDLAAGELVAPAAILALRQAAGPEVTFLAFGSHVDTDALAAAAGAGCDPVLPRSKFSAELPELIRRYLPEG
jgi:hypothetical protein